LLATRGRKDNDALSYVEQYLRREHIDDLSYGCAMATYCGEIARQDPEIASAFTEGTTNMIQLLEEALREQMSAGSARSKALFLIAALAGSVAMVRAIKRTDPQLADEMLQASLKEAGELTRKEL
jgi:TetR/AcrR family transcriptional repressor of nem operon